MPGRRVRTALAAAAALCAVACGPRLDVDLAPGAHAGANVLVVLLDTQRADRLSDFGGTPGLTPFLDGLAARSVVFHRAYAAAPWTKPSVASLLTSRLPSQHGVTTLLSVLRDEETTLPEVLEANGWLTQSFTTSFFAVAQGFAQGFDGVRWLPPVGVAHGDATTAVPPGLDRLRPEVVDWALDLPLDRRRAGTFLYLHLMDSHFPSVVDADAPGRAARRRDRPAPGADFDGLAHDYRKDPPAFADYYDAMVLSLDRRLARLFDDLARVGFLDRTIVVVVADHGEELFDHGRMGHGQTLYEELIRVPLLIALPAQRQRVDVDEAVSLLDVAPTVLGLLGVPVPPSFEGRDVGRTIARADGPVARARRAIGWPATGDGTAWAEWSPLRPDAAATSPWREVVVRGDAKFGRRADGAWEAVDLARDPHEESVRPATDRQLATVQPAFAWLEERRRSAAASTDEPLSPEAAEHLRALGYLK